MGYLQLSRNRLRDKIDRSISLLESCSVCPRRCGVNRLEDRKGVCRSGRKALISSYGPHYGEESVLVGRYGSGTIFFANCNLGCVFCQNYEISHGGEGWEVTPQELGKIMLEVQKS